VAIVSETAARLLWPRGDALGQMLTLEGRPAIRPRGEAHSIAVVIGIAQDSVYTLFASNSDRPPTRALCIFPAGLHSKLPFATMVVRMHGAPESARRAVEQAVEAVAPDQASIASEQDVLDRNFYPMRALASISGCLAVLALLLTVSGVFGVSSYGDAAEEGVWNSNRARGGRGGIMGLAFAASLRLAAAGAALGVLAALAVARVIAHTLTQDGPL